MMLGTALLSLVSLAPQSSPERDSRPPTFVVEARRLVVAPDTVLENEALLIRDGRVSQVGPEIPADAKRGLPVREYDTVVPGFVDPHGHLSLGDDLAERITPVTADLLATDAFDPFDPALLDSARAGVTTIALAPLSMNTVAGLAGVVHTGEEGVVAEPAAYLKVALVRESLDQNRYPTSAMGAADLIRNSFEEARLPVRVDPSYAVLRAVRDGQPMMIHARTHAEITRALDLCESLSVTPLLLGADEVERSLDRVGRLGGRVVLEALTLDATLRQLELPAELEKAGVPFAFTTRARAVETTSTPTVQLPPGIPARFAEMFRGQSTRRLTAPPKADPHELRVAAALAVRHGLSRTAALAALTSTPAAIIGAQDSCGTLRRGTRADFAAFDGDPIDLTARLTAVHVGGRSIDLHDGDDPQADR